MTLATPANQTASDKVQNSGRLDPEIETEAEGKDYRLTTAVGSAGSRRNNDIGNGIYVSEWNRLDLV